MSYIYDTTVSGKSHDMVIMYEIQIFISSVIQTRTKNLLFRFDLTYPQDKKYPDDNQIIKRCMDSFKHYGNRRGLAPHYFWVREQSMNSNQEAHHYHAFALLKGSVIQNPYEVLQKLTELWGRALGGIDASGLVHYCKHGFPNQANPYAIQIRRTDPYLEETKQQIWNWLQYLAKLYSKEGRPYRQKSYSHTKI